MTNICHHCENRGGDIVMCGGEVKEIVTQENGKFVIDLACVTCGKGHSTQPVVLNIPREIAQTVFPGFFPEQTKLF